MNQIINTYLHDSLEKASCLGTGTTQEKGINSQSKYWPASQACLLICGRKSHTMKYSPHSMLLVDDL